MNTAVLAGAEPAETRSGTAPGLHIVVIDECDVVHAGIASWCRNTQPPIEVAACLHHPRDLLAAPTPPEADVVVFDIAVSGARPDFDSLAAMTAAGYRVVIYSQLGTDEVILTCRDLGAACYLVKTEGRCHLIDAIRAAHQHRPYASPQLAAALARGCAAGRTNLSDREKQVLITWFQTESKELVGSRLYIAPTTVRTHLQRARAKYAAVGRPANTKAALLARAVEDGILSLSEL